MKNKIMVCVLAGALLVSACQTTKEGIGTILGAGVGVLAGSQIGSGNGQIVAMIAGGVAGAVAGNMLGSYLDEQDKNEVAYSANDTLDTTAAGETVSWANADGVEVKMTPGEERPETVETEILRKKGVAATPSIDLFGETYIANKNANLRAAPNSDSEILGKLTAGERFQAIGRVTGEEWIVVGQNYRSIGYVLDSLVGPAPKIDSKQVATTDHSAQTKGAKTIAIDGSVATDKKQPMRDAVDIDSLVTKEAIDLNAEGFVVDKVQSTTICRDLTMDVSAPDQKPAETNSVRACKTADGAWEIG